MTASAAIGSAVVFVWSGMVLAISFIEAPLKFRAPGVTVRIGLGIGRLVFRVLNAVETVLAAALVIAASLAAPSLGVVIAGAVAIGTLLVQLAVVRPRLTQRSDHVLAGEDVPRSRAHYAYVALEFVKVIALLVTGVLLLALRALFIRARSKKIRHRRGCERGTVALRRSCLVCETGRRPGRRPAWQATGARRSSSASLPSALITSCARRCC